MRWKIWQLWRSTKSSDSGSGGAAANSSHSGGCAPIAGKRRGSHVFSVRGRQRTRRAAESSTTPTAAAAATPSNSRAGTAATTTTTTATATAPTTASSSAAAGPDDSSKPTSSRSKWHFSPAQPPRPVTSVKPKPSTASIPRQALTLRKKSSRHSAPPTSPPLPPLSHPVIQLQPAPRPRTTSSSASFPQLHRAFDGETIATNSSLTSDDDDETHAEFTTPTTPTPIEFLPAFLPHKKKGSSSSTGAIRLKHPTALSAPPPPRAPHHLPLPPSPPKHRPQRSLASIDVRASLLIAAAEEESHNLIATITREEDERRAAARAISGLDTDSDEDNEEEEDMSSVPDTAQAGKSDTSSQPVPPTPKKQEKKGKQAQKEQQSQANGGQTPAPAGEKKLTGKELKEAKKAEKQARRAAEKAEKGAPADSSGPSGGNASAPGGQNKQAAHTSKEQQQQHGSSSTGVKKKKGQQSQAEEAVDSNDILRKLLPFFEHLREEKSDIDVTRIHKDVHPFVARLSLQFKNFDIMGSAARCAYTLFAFREVVRDYKTPEGVSLSRNLTQHLGLQITQLANGRKLSVAQGNAIRWLKGSVIEIKPDMPEEEAKEELLFAIDNFIKERIIAAQEVIARIAAEKISDGDVILTYAKSSCVERVFYEAAAVQGKKFTVIVVDNRPFYEGRKLARTLIEANVGITVKYTYLNGVSYVMKTVDKVFFGAHSMFANGYCYSRAGTALCAMIAHEYQKPVMICCEALKFTDKITLDGITSNELGPIDPLTDLSTLEDQSIPGPLSNHAETPNLHIVHLMYDATPPDYITSVITEVGSISPTSVPVVHRLISDREGISGTA